MAKGVSIPLATVRIFGSLREALVVRASKNGRSVNPEVVTILQTAVDEDRSPKSAESFVQQEIDKLKEVLPETLKIIYGRDEK